MAVLDLAPAEPAKQPAATAPPLVVDLDGTLVKTDLLVESLAALFKQAPWRLMSLPFWLLKGRAHFKEQIARRVSLDVEALPYREELVDYVRLQRAAGRTLVLATAAGKELAGHIADHLKLFDVVLSSDGSTNLAGKSKRDLLVKKFGEKGFDYAGDSVEDLPVWASARQAIAVNPGWRVVSRTARAGHVRRAFEERATTLLDYLKVLRPHHWVKNLLLFASLVAAHQIAPAPLAKLLVAFLSFGCFASAGYLANDLLDLSADRRHPHKRLRPFAAGNLPLAYALLMIPILLGIGCASAKLVSGLFFAAAWTYFGLSLSYSMWVRKIAVLDVIFLAGLYSMRILAGSAAVSVWPSHWLLALSTFLFFSMALVKRYGELIIVKRADGDGAKARGYELSDGELLASMGIASGYLGVLVLALYISSDQAQALYGHYEVMWLLCPLLLYWISHVWLVAHRGKMPDDPVVFALHDQSSWILGGLIVAVSLLAL